MLTPEYKKFLDSARQVYIESGCDGLVVVPQHLVDELNHSVQDKINDGLREVRKQLAYAEEKSKSIYFTS